MKRCIYVIPNKSFSTLARMLYSNLNFIDEVLSSEFKKHWIHLSLENFANIYNLSCTYSIYDNNEEGNELNFLDTSTLFLLDPNSHIYTFFIDGIVRQYIQLIHYMVNCVLFPKKNNSSHLNNLTCE